MRYVELYDSLKVRQDVFRMSALVHVLRQVSTHRLCRCKGNEIDSSVMKLGAKGGKTIFRNLG